MANTKISALPTGTLTSNTIIPAVDLDAGVSTNVSYPLQAILAEYGGSGTKLTLSGTSQGTLALNTSNFSVSNGTLSVSAGTALTLSGNAESTLALNPSSFSVSNGTLTATSGTSLSFSNTAQTALVIDPGTLLVSNGTLSVAETNFANLPAATSLAGTNEILIVANNTAYSCTLQQLANEMLVLTAPSITISNIAAQYVGNPFSVTGTLTNYSSAPTLSYQDNSGSYSSVSGTITSNSFTFTHPALSTVGTYTVGIEDGNGVHATSDAFTVSYATATAASLSGVPSTGTAGTAFTGITAALTPSYARAYAVLDIGGVDQGTRTAFTGTSYPSLTPSSAGTYTANIFAASTGGSALATSGNIVVGNVAATGATVTAPSTGTVGTAITATVALTPSNATAYACLNNGSDILPRTMFTGTSVNLTPTATGTDTIKIYAAATGGSALATSGNIVISAASTPSINGGVSPIMVLDASVASHVTSDNAWTTPQTTNGGPVNGWKDSTGNGISWNAYNNGTTGASLVTNSANGMNGIFFPQASSQVAFVQSASSGQNNQITPALASAFESATTGVTVAMVCEYTSNSMSGDAQILQITDSGFSNQVLVGPKANYFHGIGNQNSGPLGVPIPNTLNIVVLTFNPANGTSTIYINNAAGVTVTNAQNYSGVTFIGGALGNLSGGATDANNTLYEVDIWNTLASGTGGATPTGDIATIMTYLQNKWG